MNIWPIPPVGCALAVLGVAAGLLVGIGFLLGRFL